jgi:hypothetical protein
MVPAASLAVEQSSRHAGARPVVLVARMRYEMQCNWPGPGSLVFRFPSAVRLPARIAAGAVLVNGKAATAARPSAGVVSVALPPRKGIMCDLMGPGTVTVTFTRAAAIGNPKHAGSYTVRAQHVQEVAAGNLVVSVKPA